MFKFLVSSFLALVAVQSCLGQLIPPIDDPLYIDDVELSLDPFAPIASGTVSLRSGVVTGLSTLTSSLDTSAGGVGAVNIKLAIGVPTVEIHGDYTSDIILALKDLIPIIAEDLNIIGQGELLAGLSAGNLTVTARLVYLGTVRIAALDIGLSFESASANLEDLSVNGGLIEWDQFSPAIKPIFDKVWGDNKDNITETIRTAVNEIIKDCTIGQIIGIIGGNGTAECLNFPPITPIVTTTQEPDPSDQPDETTTEDGGPGPEETTVATEAPPEPKPTTTPTPSSSVVLKPLYDIMYLFLLIAAANVLHFTN